MKIWKNIHNKKFTTLKGEKWAKLNTINISFTILRRFQLTEHDNLLSPYGPFCIYMLYLSARDTFWEQKENSPAFLSSHVAPISKTRVTPMENMTAVFLWIFHSTIHVQIRCMGGTRKLHCRKIHLCRGWINKLKVNTDCWSI